MINLTSATGSVNDQPLSSPQNIVIVLYKQPTNKEEHNEEENSGDRDKTMADLAMVVMTVL